MIKINDHSNQIQKSALINECKGNIFEFLVTQKLASLSNLEAQFLYSLPLDYKLRLSEYEEIVREYDPILLENLPVFASEVSKKIWTEIKLLNLNFQQWNVIGKIVATNEQDVWNETDIVGSYLEDGQIKHKTFSLKLSKEHSYTNTKSAGVKSFIEKYFSQFKDAKLFQVELNQIVDQSFIKMGHQLYELAGLEFKGAFDEKWRSHYSELPGEVPSEMKPILYENYYQIAKKLYSSLLFFSQENIDSFKSSLVTLCGFGHPDIIQVNCYHSHNVLKSIEIKTFNQVFSQAKLVLLPIKDLSSSVEIIVGELSLQIRVKPMNKFTQPAYKINCSIKASK